MPRSRRNRKVKVQKKSTPPEAVSSYFLSLPPEVRFPIISQLSLRDALRLRLTCRSLNSEVLFFYPTFQMTICGDHLSLEQLQFVDQIHLQCITFKRVAKSLVTSPISSPGLVSSTSSDYPTWMCTRKKFYSGPDRFITVGGIQVRSLSAPLKCVNQATSIYDYTHLKRYLMSVASDDIFKHIHNSDNNSNNNNSVH